MEHKTLDVAVRDTLKKGSAGRLRREGKIPAIVYGHGEPTAIAVDAHEFMKKFHTISESTVIRLQTGKKDMDVLVKDYQSDILSGKVLHIDFYEVEKGKMVRTRVPVHAKGNPIGVREGGVLEHLLHEIEVEAIPSDLPEFIDVDISGIKIGSGLHVADLVLPNGVKALTPAEQIILTVTFAKATVTPAAEETAGAEAATEGAEGTAATGPATSTGA